MEALGGKIPRNVRLDDWITTFLMNYRESIGYIEKLQAKKGITFGLERIKKALAIFGNPQDAICSIHIAGTNGKGSVCAYITAMLCACGQKVGQFSSPKIEYEHDCISINGKSIAKKTFAALITKVVQCVPDIELSAFELVTVSAFLYFRDRNCKILVIEAGMGGRLDATNVMRAPLACVFTPISIDHTRFLGSGLLDIAENKCGIMKKGAQVISAAQANSVSDLIAQKALEITGNDAVFVNEKDFLIKVQKPDRSIFSYRTYKNLCLRMAGLHQIQNAALAIEVVRSLGYEVIGSALETVCVPGRFETVSQNPRIIIDGAHNAAGAKSLSNTILRFFSDRARILILGILSDKDYEDIIKVLSNCAHHIITVATPIPRGMGALELAQAAALYTKHVTAADSAAEALDLAKTLAGADGVIIATGSLTYLTQIRKH